MDRCSFGVLLVCASSLLLSLAGCAGKGTPLASTETVQTVALSPASHISVDLGSTQTTFTASARNGAGQTVVTPIEFMVSCVPNTVCAPLSVANTGQACAGAWDSLITPLVCTPGTAGVAQVTAVALGVSSPPTIVYIHQHIDNITAAPVGTPQTNCFSLGDPDPQKTTWKYQATAFSNGVDITSTVGPMTWSSSATNVATLNTTASGLQPNQVQVTAKTPGLTELTASVSTVNSNPVAFTTCLVSSIMLQIQNGSGNKVNFSNGGSQVIEATVLDTLGNAVSSPPLTWSSTNPEVAAFSATTTTSRTNTVNAKANLGGADVFASCTPPSCNIGVLPGLPVYSTGGTLPPPNGQPAFGVISINVTNSKVPTYTAWAATTGCGANFNCTSVMFPVTPGNTPIGAGVTLSRTPNSLMFTPVGGSTTAYLGSDQGLMILTASATPSVSVVSQSATPCNVSLCGKVLAISPDGNRVVVADTTSTPNQVYIYDNTHPNSAAVDLLITGANAAAFSPDGMKAFILSNTEKMYVYSTVDALSSVPISNSATDLAFAADGSLAYVAGTPGASLSGFSTCGTAGAGSTNLGSVATASVPLKIAPSPDIQETILDKNHSQVTQQVIALEPPAIQVLTAEFKGEPLGPDQTTCNVPVLTSFTAALPINLGQGTFIPLYMKLAGNGSQVMVVAKNVPAVLVLDLNAGVTTAFPLVNNGMPVAASASTDGSQIFVTTTDGTIHMVNTLNGGDAQQAAYTNPNTQNSMCNNLDPTTNFCAPDLIAIKPQ